MLNRKALMIGSASLGWHVLSPPKTIKPSETAGATEHVMTNGSTRRVYTRRSTRSWELSFDALKPEELLVMRCLADTHEEFFMVHPDAAMANAVSKPISVGRLADKTRFAFRLSRPGGGPIIPGHAYRVAAGEETIQVPLMTHLDANVSLWVQGTGSVTFDGDAKSASGGWYRFSWPMAKTTTEDGVRLTSITIPDGISAFTGVQVRYGSTALPPFCLGDGGVSCTMTEDIDRAPGVTTTQGLRQAATFRVTEETL